MSEEPRVVVAPADLPVTIAEALTQCRQSDTSEVVIEEMAELIASAAQLAEKSMNRALITQTLEMRWARWPRDGALRLPRAPLQEVLSITYLDRDGTRQTWDAAEYRVNEYAEPATVELAHGKSWPDFREESGSIVVSYKAGYGDSRDAVPPMIRRALLNVVVHQYDFRGEILTGTIQSPLPLAAQTILLQERVHE